jgi:hypothetical protein
MLPAGEARVGDLSDEANAAAGRGMILRPWRWPDCQWDCWPVSGTFWLLGADRGIFGRCKFRLLETLDNLAASAGPGARPCGSCWPVIRRLAAPELEGSFRGASELGALQWGPAGRRSTKNGNRPGSETSADAKAGSCLAPLPFFACNLSDSDGTTQTARDLRCGQPVRTTCACGAGGKQVHMGSIRQDAYVHPPSPAWQSRWTLSSAFPK